MLRFCRHRTVLVNITVAQLRNCGAAAVAATTDESRGDRVPRYPPNKHLPPQNIHSAIELVQQQARARFDESVEIAIQLNVDPRKQNQAVRGVAVLPQGLGKKIRVAVICSGSDVEIAKQSGADVVGSEDLILDIQEGKINFDRCVATPEMMSKMGRIGKILGPRGLMPNPKLGTVTTDVERAVKLAKTGTVNFRVEKQGIIHAPVGKVSFTKNALLDNVRSLMVALFAAKPEGLKGKYVKCLHMCSTQGRSVSIDVATCDPGNPKFMLDPEGIAKLGF